MENSDDISKILSKVFNNKKFIKDLMLYENKQLEFADIIIEKRLSEVLCYYIATRDNNTNYTYGEIKQKYDEIINTEFNGIYHGNVIENGFLTHSFNGYKRERIDKYGLNYMDKINQNEKDKINHMRNELNKLEEILGKSPFIEIGEKSEKGIDPNEIFLSTPGTKTIYYACQNSPERLYEGPLSQPYNNPEPIIIGESKSLYMFRILEKKIKNKYKDTSSQEYLDSIENAKNVVEDYCQSEPAFALIELNKIKDIPYSIARYDSNQSNTVEESLQSKNFSTIGQFFTSGPNDMAEYSDMGDMATLSNYIPQDAIKIVNIMDFFEMKQIFAKSIGLNIGDMIDYATCQYRGDPTIEQLINLIDNMNTKKDLDILNNKYLSVRKQIEQKMEKTNLRYMTIEEIKKYRKNIINKRKKILQREYIKKDELIENYTLEDILERMKSNGSMQKLLRKDNEIIKDKLQYDSDLHGVKHTRRVNFFAMVIMDLERVRGKDRDIILEIVKNHDIGRINDIEDKEHGKRSVKILEENSEKLEKFDENERELIKFVIEQHSMSQKENMEAIKQLFTMKEKTQEAFGSKKRMEKLDKYVKILGICKDADKLDRVRLDPRGIYLDEGLDARRLSLESSKKLEATAYEAYNKILEVLDIEKRLIKIDSILKLKEEQEMFSDFEKKMKEQRKLCKNKTDIFLREIISRSKKDVGFVTGINKIISKVKNMYRSRNDNKKIDNNVK